MKMIIRKMKIEDAEAIRRFHRRSWRDTYPNEKAGVSREWVERVTDEWLTQEKMERSLEIFQSVIDDEKNQYYRLVEVDGEVMGFVHGTRRDDSGEQHLDAIYIDKDLQGTGMAQKLVGGLFGFLDLTRDIWLEVVSYNERAKAFYRKNGFEEVKGSDFLFKEVMPSIKMVRKGEEK